MAAHEVNKDGESTAKWAMREPEFFGTIKQLTCCARCGEVLKGGKDKRRHVFEMLKPSMHFVCDDCYDELPD